MWHFIIFICSITCIGVLVGQINPSVCYVLIYLFVFSCLLKVIPLSYITTFYYSPPDLFDEVYKPLQKDSHVVNLDLDFQLFLTSHSLRKVRLYSHVLLGVFPVFEPDVLLDFPLVLPVSWYLLPLVLITFYYTLFIRSILGTLQICLHISTLNGSF